VCLPDEPTVGASTGAGDFHNDSISSQTEAAIAAAALLIMQNIATMMSIATAGFTYVFLHYF
jgi:hypothetical protein